MGKTELKVEIDAALLAEARAAGVDVQRITEAALRQAVGATGVEERAARWADENAEAIAAHRKQIDEHGVFGDDFRTW